MNAAAQLPFSPEFTELVSEWLPIMILDTNYHIEFISKVAARIAGYEDPSKFIGAEWPAETSAMRVKDFADWFAEEDVVSSDDGFGKLMREAMFPVARQKGFAVTWCWMVDVDTRCLNRVAINIHYLAKHDKFGFIMTPLDDGTSHGFSLLRKGGIVVDHSGAALKKEDLALLHLFMAGKSLKAMVQELNKSEAIVRRKLKELCTAMGHTTPAKLRESLWEDYSQEVLFQSDAVVPGKLKGVYGIS